MSSTQIGRAVAYLPVLLRGRPLHNEERYRPFFIVGSGRCGTTLLRATLQAHPDVHIPPENPPLQRVMQDYRLISRLPWHIVSLIVLAGFEYHAYWERFEMSLAPLFRETLSWPRDRRTFAAVVDALYRAHARLYKPSATRWGDKTPSNAFALGEIRAAFPDARVIHLIRDGRDVVASFLRMYAPGLSFYADLWVRAIHAGRRFGARHPQQYLEIRYEDFVRGPRATLSTVADFLGLTFTEEMLHHTESRSWLRDIERAPHLQGVWQPVSEGSIGRWRSALDGGQIAQLNRLLEPTLDLLHYERA